ncbi:hypothetical protein EYZ11_013473 [Aspergillus tanneri]|uniref:Uncharacterized protein n=1 Tax=Aspergillus tanneri TaxID=1220188 RepID=A0A4S3IY39_9EURO|nr:hypothetical protein EYZ11_013473 [Aspergillus tanneri]
MSSQCSNELIASIAASIGSIFVDI